MWSAAVCQRFRFCYLAVIFSESNKRCSAGLVHDFGSLASVLSRLYVHRYRRGAALAGHVRIALRFVVVEATKQVAEEIAYTVAGPAG